MNYLLIINHKSISVKILFGIHLILSFIKDENKCVQ